MGDRTTVYFTVAGKIGRDDLSTLIEAMAAEGFRSNDDDAEPCADNLDETFYASEVNYANIDDLTAVCDRLGLDREHWWEAGGGYGAGIERCRGGECRERSASEASPVFTLAEILDITEQLAGMANLVREAKWWSDPLGSLEIVETATA